MQYATAEGPRTGEVAEMDKDRMSADSFAAAKSRAFAAVLTLCFWLTSGFGATAQAADSTARPLPREFDPFDILAWEVLAGLDASGEALSRGGAAADDRLRIAIRPFHKGRSPLPASLANGYNDKLLVSLLSQGGDRYRFVARDALGAVIKEIDESSARQAELDDLLTALVESAKADVLVVGKLRRTSETTAVLSYEVVEVLDGTILAATSFQRLPLDPAEVEMAARAESRAKGARQPLQPAPGPRPQEPDPDIETLQADLRTLGYDPGPVDGILGARTAAAIRDYQRDTGLPVDGKPSPALAVSLRADRVAHKVWAKRKKTVKRAPAAHRRDRPKTYGSDGTYCREFQHDVIIGGAVQASYGTACLQADGSWKIVK